MNFSQYITDANIGNNVTDCKKDAESISSPVTIVVLISLVVCVFGVIGNALCAVVLFNKRMSRSSYTYLLQGLTISDTLSLMRGIQAYLSILGVISVGNNDYVNAILFLWNFTGVLGTGYFTVAIALERIFVITYPLKAHAVLTPGRSKRIAFGIFVFCVLMPYFMYISQKWINYYYFAAVQHLLVVIIVPFVLVVILNVLILIQLRRIRNLAIRKTSTGDNVINYQVTKMLFAVILVFGIVSLFDVVRIIYNKLWPNLCGNGYFIDYVAILLDWINSSVNFILYSLLDNKFRGVFCEIFRIPQNTKRNDNSRVMTTTMPCNTTMSSLTIEENI